MKYSKMQKAGDRLRQAQLPRSPKSELLPKLSQTQAAGKRLTAQGFSIGLCPLSLGVELRCPLSQTTISTITLMIFMKNLALLSVTTLAATSGLVIRTIQSASALSWNWNYSGTGITASGTFITNDTPNDLGFYLISGITGTRNGETITGLQPTGTPIPGNEPFHVDNLINLNTPQLTGDGFGYFTSGGNYVSPFFASFLPTPSYLEVFSAPPFTPGFENLGPEDSELPISFSATLVAVPEPTSILSLLAFGTFGAGSLLKRFL